MNTCKYCEKYNNRSHTTEEHICKICEEKGHSRNEHRCDMCNGRHSTKDHKCSFCDDINCIKHCQYCIYPKFITSIIKYFIHKSEGHICEICKEPGHNFRIHRCKICNHINHTTADHICSKCQITGHDIASHKCKYCYSLDHDTENHKCSICGIVNHEYPFEENIINTEYFIEISKLATEFIIDDLFNIIKEYIGQNAYHYICDTDTCGYISSVIQEMDNPHEHNVLENEQNEDDEYW